jgi:hypothetical protein
MAVISSAVAKSLRFFSNARRAHQNRDKPSASQRQYVATVRLDSNALSQRMGLARACDGANLISQNSLMDTPLHSLAASGETRRSISVAAETSKWTIVA